jgi:hypothetical protein
MFFHQYLTRVLEYHGRCFVAKTAGRRSVALMTSSSLSSIFARRDSRPLFANGFPRVCACVCARVRSPTALMDRRFQERCQAVLVLDPPAMTPSELQNALALSQTLLRHTLLEVDRLIDRNDELLSQNEKMASQLERSAQYLHKVLSSRGGTGGKGGGNRGTRRGPSFEFDE